MKHRLPVVAVAALIFFVTPGCLGVYEICENVNFGLAPTIPVGVDRDTNAIMVGFEGGCPPIPGIVCISPALEVGRGSETYSYSGEFLKQNIIVDESVDYTVVTARVHGRYPFPIGEEGDFAISPIVGPRFYRWMQDDCDFEGCDENLFVLDVGAGAQYKNFGLDFFTGLNGPNFSARLKYTF